MMIKRFLVPVNLAFAEPALLATRLARLFGAEIVFFHCLPFSAQASKFFFPKSAEQTARNQILPEERRRAEERISIFESLLPLDGLRHRWKISKGAVLQEILKAADSVRPEWIIQGSRRSPGFEGWIPGGTAWWTIQKAPCPVITLKHRHSGARDIRGFGEFHRDTPEDGPKRGGPAPPSLREILYLSGSGKSSGRALTAAAALAKKGGAELVVLHVTDPTRRGDPDGPKEDPDARVQRLVERARLLQTGLNVSSSLLVGNPAETVLARIRLGKPDMVVMGAADTGAMAILPAAGFRERIFQGTTSPIMTVNRSFPGLQKRPRIPVQKEAARRQLLEMGEEHPESIGEDLFFGRGGSRASSLFLKHYSKEGLVRLFEEEGLLALLRERGFAEPKIAIHLDDPYRQRLRVYFGETEDESHTLIEMILHEGVLEAPRPRESPHRGHYFPVLTVEWLAMQNPAAPFSPERPPLPDQRYPGLGVSREVLELIARIGTQIGKDGIAIHPRCYHAAVIYHRLFRCYNPVQEGQLAALIRDTEAFNLNDVSWAVSLGCLEDGSLQEGVSWKIDYQVRPLTVLLQNHFHSENYRKLFWNSLGNHHYQIRRKQLDKRLRERTGREEAAP